MKVAKQIIFYLLLSAFALAQSALYTYFQSLTKKYYRGATTLFVINIIMYLLFGIFLALLTKSHPITSWKTGLFLAAVNIVLYRIFFFRLWFGSLPNLLLLLSGYEILQPLPSKNHSSNLPRDE